MSASEFALPFLSFLALNFLVGLNAFGLTLLLKKGHFKDIFTLLFSVVLLFLTQISLSEIALGALGLLSKNSLYEVHLALLLITTVIFFKKKNKLQISFEKSQELKKAFWILSPIAFLFVLRYFYALYQTPLDYDSLSYHLPIAVEWFQTGRLMDPYYNAFAGPLGYYPSNFELLELWTFYAFHNDLFVNFLNFLIYPLLGLSFYAVLKNLNVEKNSALFGSLLFLSIPQFCHLLGYANVELYFSFLFLSSLFFAQEYQKEPSAFHVMFSGIALGLFMGTKYLGLPYALPLFALLALLIGIQRWTHKKMLMKELFLLALFTFLTGAFFYIRNWINSGNPLFPTEVSLLGHTLFKGYHGLTDRIFNDSILANLKDWVTLKEILSTFALRYGAVLLLLPLSLVLTVLKLMKRKSSKTEILLLGASLLYLYLYCSAPYSYGNLLANIRYAVIFMVLSVLWIVHAFQGGRLAKQLFKILTIGLVAYNVFFLILLAPSQSQFIVLEKIPLDLSFLSQHVLALLGFIGFIFLSAFTVERLLIFLEKKTKKTQWILLSTSLLWVLSCTSMFAYSSEARELSKDFFFEKSFDEGRLQIPDLLKAAEWFDQNAAEAKIAYTGSSFHYYFFGRSLQREVDYININDCKECRYVDYRDATDSIRTNPSFEAWSENLKAKEKEFIVIAEGVVPQVKLWELDWVTAHPNSFKRVFQSNGVSIYEILPNL